MTYRFVVVVVIGKPAARSDLWSDVEYSTFCRIMFSTLSLSLSSSLSSLSYWPWLGLKMSFNYFVTCLSTGRHRQILTITWHGTICSIAAIVTNYWQQYLSQSQSQSQTESESRCGSGTGRGESQLLSCFRPGSKQERERENDRTLAPALSEEADGIVEGYKESTN